MNAHGFFEDAFLCYSVTLWKLRNCNITSHCKKYCLIMMLVSFYLCSSPNECLSKIKCIYKLDFITVWMKPEWKWAGYIFYCNCVSVFSVCEYMCIHWAVSHRTYHLSPDPDFLHQGIEKRSHTSLCFLMHVGVVLGHMHECKCASDRFTHVKQFWVLGES